jgi:hypothetical protein
MSRNQWIVITVLGLAVAVVLGCFGGYVLTYLTQQPPAETPQAVQAVDTPTSVVFPTPFPTYSPTTILATATPEPPRPTNTRVIPLTTPTPVPPTLTPTPYPTYTSYPTYTPPPTPTSMPAPVPTSPPAPPPPTPTPDTRCVDNENAYHQQMLAYIDASYQPTFEWIEYQIELAVRDRDARRIRDLQRQYEMYENTKQADINAENARHQAALAACG